jgi:cation diffusion facilitator CzcD-associated flavoprotein CzcO
MITIIGAGPAGLAMGYALRQHNLPFTILERHGVGYAWQNHYDRLHLHTLKQVSALPGRPMPATYPAFPSAAQVHAYLVDYAAHFNLPIESGVDVRRITPTTEGWRLETSAGERTAQAIVLATGIWSTPVVPPIDGLADFGGPVIHSAFYRNPAPYGGKRVLVVGAGNSGSEIAVDLASAGVATAIAVRGGVVFVPCPASPAAVRFGAWLYATLPDPISEMLLHHTRPDFSRLGLPRPAGALRHAYPTVGFQLPQAVERGDVRVYPALERLAPGRAHFADGTSAPFDAIIMATGYRAGLQPAAHLVQTDAAGRPIVDRYGRARGQRRLYCVGYHYPATAGWLQSIGAVVRRAAAAIRADDA